MADPSLAAYLRWFRAQTEAAWRTIDVNPVERYRTHGIVGGNTWQRSTVWLGGLGPAEIDAIELRYGIAFPPDYRLFLAILNAPDRGLYGARWADNRTLARAPDRPSFYDWHTDETAIRHALHRPLEGLLYDVESNGLWQESWGPRPSTAQERQARLTTLFDAAPRLVPIIGHRYLVTKTGRLRCPVLSIVQSDIVVYATDLRNLLSRECAELLEAAAEPAPPDDSPRSDLEVDAIPFWGELIG